MQTLFLVLALLLTAVHGSAQTQVAGRPSVVLDGKSAQVVIDLLGGSIVGFQFQDQRLNPLVWNNEGDPSQARSMSHFVCLDRWGRPSDAERLNGMTNHGEAATVPWKTLSGPAKKSGGVHAEMEAMLPMAGLHLKRNIMLAAGKALFTVTEVVTNRNKLGRVYNMVQHPTVGPPFLDETTVVDSNARKGFMQSSPLPNPEEPSVVWPQALKDGQPVNMRRLSADPDPNVVSYTIDQEYGWATAATPAKGLLIGYIWKTEEYPWLNMWRHVDKGKPLARGLEFGTTGLHQPYSILIEKGRIFGRQILAHIDTGESVSKSYAAFLFKIPSDYRGVASVSYAGGRLTLHERETGPERDLEMETGELFPE
jgi:hypothetical protein